MNFALILLCLTVFTGIFWFADILHFKRKREDRFVAEVAALDARMAQHRDTYAPDHRQNEVARLTRELRVAPVWLEFPASFFPVISIVFALRSFVVEPFKIPSGSMIPTLQIGDFILVNKFTYGVRLPVINTKIVDVGLPQRGDVMVFRYPQEPSLDYIKRVVGVSGDKISYENKRLSINGVPVPVKQMPDYLHKERASYSHQFEAEIGPKRFRYLTDDHVPPFIDRARDFPMRSNCIYNEAGVVCTVPAGHYFMMGDNRDNSEDSRFWGFVPEGNIVGRAFGIWMNWSEGLNIDLSRIGGFD